jgi:hypothetical protein
MLLKSSEEFKTDHFVAELHTLKITDFICIHIADLSKAREI